jgi:hypothetical protein
MALRLAGARSVAVIVLGRHLAAGQAAVAAGQQEAGHQARFMADFSPAVMPFRVGLCAVHRAPAAADAAVLPGATRSPGAGT